MPIYAIKLTVVVVGEAPSIEAARLRAHEWASKELNTNGKDDGLEAWPIVDATDIPAGWANCYPWGPRDPNHRVGEMVPTNPRNTVGANSDA